MSFTWFLVNSVEQYRVRSLAPVVLQFLRISQLGGHSRNTVFLNVQNDEIVYTDVLQMQFRPEEELQDKTDLKFPACALRLPWVQLALQLLLVLCLFAAFQYFSQQLFSPFSL